MELSSTKEWEVPSLNWYQWKLRRLTMTVTQSPVTTPQKETRLLSKKKKLSTLVKNFNWSWRKNSKQCKEKSIRRKIEERRRGNLKKDSPWLSNKRLVHPIEYRVYQVWNLNQTLSKKWQEWVQWQKNTSTRNETCTRKYLRIIHDLT